MILHQTKAYQKIATQSLCFYGSFECLKRISDIQCQTGKPITMPTASVAIKEFAEISFLIPISLDAWATDDLQEFFERRNGLSPKLVPEVRCDQAGTRRTPESAQGVEWSRIRRGPAKRPVAIIQSDFQEKKSKSRRFRPD
jgi:hypothetical protein